MDTRVVRIDCKSYLIIGSDGKYTTSNVPKELPQGYVVHVMNDDVIGQRQFIITKDASDPPDENDTFDDVKVGTLMVDHGYAYIAGTVIHGEEPHKSNVQICFPPFVMTYSVSELNTLENELHLHVRFASEIKENLVRSIKEHNDVKAHHDLMDFDFDTNMRPDLSQEYLCEVCGGEMDNGGGHDFCRNCARLTVAEAKVIEARRRKGRGGDKVETHEDVDMDNGEDDFVGLTALGSALGISLSKQPISSVY